MMGVSLTIWQTKNLALHSDGQIVENGGIRHSRRFQLSGCCTITSLVVSMDLEIWPR
jgi:hypothetical protein